MPPNRRSVAFCFSDEADQRRLLFRLRERLRLAPERFRELLERPRLLLLLLRLRPLLERLRVLRLLPEDLRLRVDAAFLAAEERDDLEREAEARPPFLPPFLDELRFVFLPRPEPLFLPPPVSLFTVAQARRSASFRDVPRFSYPSSICSAWRFCLLV